MATYLAGIRLILRLVKTPSMRRYTDGIPRFDPQLCASSPCGCPPKGDDGATFDSFWECTVRAAASTVYHPAGTARMGAVDDQMSVVDPRLRVKGTQNLWVADASVMPTIVRKFSSRHLCLFVACCTNYVRARHTQPLLDDKSMHASLVESDWLAQLCIIGGV